MSAPRAVDLRAYRPGDDLTELVGHLRGGGLLVHPTETVYGVGCVLDPGPLDRLSRLKRRPPDRPFLVLVPDIEATAGLAWTDEARALAGVFWPGALTLVLGDPGGTFPEAVRGRSGGVAVRRTSHPLTRALVEALGAPVTSTSANRPGEAPARDAERALEAMGALGAGPEVWVVDAGALPESAPSTIVDCTGTRARVRRPGATPLARLRCVLPEMARPEAEDDGSES